jgi:hypothetical protein
MYSFVSEDWKAGIPGRLKALNGELSLTSKPFGFLAFYCVRDIFFDL